MIAQQINLFQARFHKKRPIASAKQISALVLVLVVGLLIATAIIENDLGEARSFNLALKQHQQQSNQALTEANTELARLLGDDKPALQITRISHEINARRNMLNFVDANQFGSGKGFSDYLLALGNLHVANLWLHKIKLTDDYIRIHGSALNAESIPAYFKRFSQEAAFRGNRFDIFQLGREPEADWKINFEIATRSSDPDK